MLFSVFVIVIFNRGRRDGLTVCWCCWHWQLAAPVLLTAEVRTGALCQGNKVESFPKFSTPILTPNFRLCCHDSRVSSNRLHDFRIGCVIFVIGFVI